MTRTTRGAAVLALCLLAAGCGVSHEEIRPQSSMGAFVGDEPSSLDLLKFKDTFGSFPDPVLIFVSWDRLPSKSVIEAIYSAGSTLMITLEPWYPEQGKKGVNLSGLLEGVHDAYLDQWVALLKEIHGTVYLRFVHEMNGNWYPWSGVQVGEKLLKQSQRYLVSYFRQAGVTNVKWVFSVNAEDVPREENHFMKYYPGDTYVDYIGLDGYNWGQTRSYSRWMSFEQIFKDRYLEILHLTDKPVMITEFASTTSGGDRDLWFQQAMRSITQMKRLSAFVYFNIDKETDWRIDPSDAEAVLFREALKLN